MGQKVKIRANIKFVIPEAAFPYLFIQKGSIDHLKADKTAWMDAYQDLIDTEFDQIWPSLPQECSYVVDIGGGMGGIDILIARHYDRQPLISIIDGEKDHAAVELHRKTFSNADVADDFLWMNGVRQRDFLTPTEARKPGAQQHKADVILSLQAWCFHFAPSEYMGLVRRIMKPSTVLIVDLRRERHAWRDEIEGDFDIVATIHMRPKAERLVLRAR